MLLGRIKYHYSSFMSTEKSATFYFYDMVLFSFDNLEFFYDRGNELCIIFFLNDAKVI